MIARQAAHPRLSLEKDQNVSNKTNSKEAGIKPWPQNEWKVSNLKLNSWEKKTSVSSQQAAIWKKPRTDDLIEKTGFFQF